MYTIYHSSNYLEVNQNNPNKILLLSSNNELVEYDVTTLSVTYAGTYEVDRNVSCKNENDNSNISVDVITLDIEVTGYDEDQYLMSGTTIIHGDYEKEGKYYEYIHLDDIAAEHLYSSEAGMNGTIFKDIDLYDTWTYLSLPTNTRVCSNMYRYNSSLDCNLNITLETMFNALSQDDLALIYTNNEWQYFNANTSNTYQMNRFNVLDYTQGVLVKVSTPTTIRVPVNIFSATKPQVINLENVGWNLIGNQYENISPEDIKVSNEIVYVVRPNDTNDDWEVYTPDTTIKLDENITIMDDMGSARGTWVYTK
jgi:hypothetical protein